MEQISPITLAPVIERFKKLTTQQWPRKHHLERAFAIYEKFLQAPELKPFVTVVLTHANARTGQMSRLKRIFSQAVLGVGGVINQRWATNYLYDAAVQKKRYTETFGDARLADCKGTIFFPAHDIVQNVDVNFYCLKKNLLKPGSSENAEVSNNNHTLIDAVMSTSAHPMAVPPHETEDKMLCTDSSPWHAFDRNVMHVKQALAAENPYAKLDVFIFNTGNDAIESVSVAQAQERITQLGLPGGFSDGTQMAMIGGNTISGAIDYLKRQLGDNHIFHLTPRLLPRTPKEAAEFPSRNVIDTSPSNMLAIQQRAQQTLIELDEEIRKCALRIAENLWSIDYYDHAQYEKCRNRIINAPVPVTDVKPPPDAPDIFDEIRTTRGKRMSHRVSTWILHNLLPLSAANDNAGRITPPAPVKNIQDRKFGP